MAGWAWGSSSKFKVQGTTIFSMGVPGSPGGLNQMHVFPEVSEIPP